MLATRKLRSKGLYAGKTFRRTHDPIWHLQLAVLAVIALQVVTSQALLPYYKYPIIFLELVLLVYLGVITPDGYRNVSYRRRAVAIGLIAVIAFVNMVSLILLLDALLNDNAVLGGRSLLYNGLAIYVTNVLMFALWYWEMDSGGPDRRATHNPSSRPDFAFTQMVHPRFAKPDWLPGFTDYLYLSATNVTNFASADTLPVSPRAKMMMMVQSLVAVVTVVLVAARAINIMQ